MPMRDARRTCLKLLILVLVVLSAVPALAKANRPATPERLDGGTIVDTPAVQALLDQGAVIFDTRSPLNYGKGHLPGALCLPYQENSRYAVDFDPRRDQVDLARLPADKGTPVVFYSHGQTGWKSYKAAVQAIRQGHAAVYWYRDGFTSWQNSGRPVD